MFCAFGRFKRPFEDSYCFLMFLASLNELLKRMFVNAVLVFLSKFNGTSRRVHREQKSVC